MMQPPNLPERPKNRAAGAIRGFFDFIQHYGVLPLAIGVVLANAVNDLVKSIVDGLISPLIALLTPQTSLQSLVVHVGNSDFKIGAVITSVISFISIALLVYVLVKLILRKDELLEKK